MQTGVLSCSRFLGVDMGGSGIRAPLVGDPAGVRDWNAPGGNLPLTARRTIAACSLLDLTDRARSRFGPRSVRYSGGVFAIRTIAERFESEASATASLVRPEVAAALIVAGRHGSRP